MEIKVDDYAVVVISSAKEAEKELLSCLSGNDVGWDDVNYIAMNSCSNKIISKSSDTNTNEISNRLFFLIKPSCLNQVIDSLLQL